LAFAPKDYYLVIAAMSDTVVPMEDEANKIEEEEEYIHNYTPSSSDAEENFIIMVACGCFASLIISLCIWGIVASSSYDTNPAEKWPKASCYVASIKDTHRACLSCNTETICGLGSPVYARDPIDGALCNRRRRTGSTTSRTLVPKNCQTRGGIKGSCETYKEYTLTMNVNSANFTGARPANRCGPKVSYTTAVWGLTQLGYEAAAWLDARGNMTVDCWYDPAGTVDSISKSSVMLDKGCTDLETQVYTVMILCIVFLVLTVCCGGFCFVFCM